MTLRTAECIAGIGENEASTSQSTVASGKLCAISETAGRVCTTSPIDEVLTMRIFTVTFSYCCADRACCCTFAAANSATSTGLKRGSLYILNWR